MTTSEVLTWDCTTEPPTEPETWVQVHSTSLKVCGGQPNVIVSAGPDRFRHTPNGMLWKCSGVAP